MDEAVNPFDLRGGAGAIRRAVAGGPDLRVLAALCATLKMKSVYNKMYLEEKKEYKEADDKNKYLDTHHNNYVRGGRGQVVSGLVANVVSVVSNLSPWGGTPSRDPQNIIDEELAYIKSAKIRSDDDKRKNSAEYKKGMDDLNKAIEDSVITLDTYFSRENYVAALSIRIKKHLATRNVIENAFANSVLEYKKKLPIQVTHLSNINICQPIKVLGMSIGYLIEPSWYRHTYVYEPASKRILGTAMYEKKFPTAEFKNVWKDALEGIKGEPARLAVLVSLSATLKTLKSQVLNVDKQNVADILMGRVYEDAVVKIITNLPTFKYQIEGKAIAGQRCKTHTNKPVAYHFVECNGSKKKMELCEECLAAPFAGSEKFAAKMCVGCLKKCKEKIMRTGDQI